VPAFVVTIVPDREEKKKRKPPQRLVEKEGGASRYVADLSLSRIGGKK